MTMRVIRRALLFLLLTLPAIAQQSVTIRVCTYNVVNFSGQNLAQAQALAKVFQHLTSDVFVLHEIVGEQGANNITAFLSKRYVKAPFTDGPDTDNGMYYDSAKIELIGHTPISTELRIIDDWTVRVKGQPDTVHILGCHLKLGETPADREQRAREISALAEYMRSWPSTHHRYLLAGDLNVYTSSEPAYDTLTGSAGMFIDPIDRPGDWHDNQAFADIHTQSPRVRQFGGGIGGGMDDRFDFILLSPYLSWVSGSYVAFGNDAHHFNDSINAMPNTAVDGVTAQALHDASDHLPVYLDVVFEGASGVEERKQVPMEMDLSWITIP
jgi:hypothetical protein